MHAVLAMECRAFEPVELIGCSFNDRLTNVRPVHLLMASSLQHVQRRLCSFAIAVVLPPRLNSTGHVTFHFDLAIVMNLIMWVRAIHGQKWLVTKFTAL